MNKQVTEYIHNAPVDQKEIMATVRALIHEHIKDVTEDFKWSRPIFKSTVPFAYFLSNKSHVTIGFTKDIEKLIDPNNHLQGSGKTMRYIKLKKASEMDVELIREWLMNITCD
jgi:hypothetical protein